MSDFELQWFGKYLTDGVRLIQVVSIEVGVLFCENCLNPEGERIKVFVDDIEGHGTAKKWRVVAFSENELMAA